MENLRAAMLARRRQLIGCNAPTIVAGISQLVEGFSDNRYSHCCAAIGFQAGQLNLPPLLHAAAAYAVTHSIANNENKLRDAAYMASMMAGELTASWKPQEGAMVGIVNYIIECVKAFLTQPNIMEKINASIAATLTVNEGDEGQLVNTQHGVNYRMTRQCNRVLLSGVVGIPSVLLNPSAILWIQSILNSNCRVNPPEAQNPGPQDGVVYAGPAQPGEPPGLNQEFNQRLRNSPRAATLDMLHFVSILMRRELTMMTHAAVFTFVVSLAKGCAVTESYLETRSARFLQDVHSAATEFGNYASVESITMYCTAYDRERAEPRLLVPMIKTVAATLQDQQINSLVWILEQAAGQHVTLASSFARAMESLPVLLPSMIFANFPISQIRAFARLAGYLRQNRFCSLSRPPVPAAEYADLGYFGFVLCKKVLLDDNIGNYQGQVEAHLLKNRGWFEALGESIKEMNEDYIRRSTDLTTLIAQTYQIEVNIEGDFAYLRQPANLNNFPGLQGVIPAGAQIEDEAQVEYRQGWPRAMRRLGRDYGRLGVNTLLDYLKSQESALHRALRTVCSWVTHATRQREFAELARNADNIASEARALTAEETAVLTTLGTAIVAPIAQDLAARAIPFIEDNVLLYRAAPVQADFLVPDAAGPFHGAFRAVPIIPQAPPPP